MRFLFIGCHCDDVELGCGGLLFKLKRKFGNDLELYYLILTHNEIRRKEQEKAAKVFNAKVFFENFQDGSLYKSYNELKQTILRYYKDISPDILFSHRKDLHRDHRTVFKILKNQNIRFFGYWTPSSIKFRPRFFVNISQYFYDKLKLLGIFKSQKLLEKGLVHYIVKVHRLNGLKIFKKYAEGFEIHS